MWGILGSSITEDLVVGYGGWHEHFHSPEKALECFAFGFSDQCRLKITWTARRHDPNPPEPMPSTTMKPALHSFAYALDFLREQVADVPPADMVAQPHGIRNHPAWAIGHLTHSCEQLAGVIGVPAWLPEAWAALFGTGSIPAADARRYEPKDEALAILRDAQSRITRAVAELEDDRLDAPFPDEAYRAVFPTVRHALTQVLVGHTAHHVGQLTVWRRAMGLPPLGRSFE